MGWREQLATRTPPEDRKNRKNGVTLEDDLSHISGFSGGTGRETVLSARCGADDPSAALVAPPVRVTALTPRAGTVPVVRLRLLIEDDGGQRHEAILAIPANRCDGLGVLELYESHLAEKSTRVIEVCEIGASGRRTSP